MLTHIVWCLENWYRWSYLQNRNRDTDAENKHMDPEGGRGGGVNPDPGIDVCAPQWLKQVTNENLLHSSGNSVQGSVVT